MTFAKKKRPTGMTGGIKKKKAPTVSKLSKKLWELCKQQTRKKYVLPNGRWTCYTCDRVIDEPSKAHTGHGIPSSVGGVLLRYELDNLRIQDYYCNINLGGNGGEFYKRLVSEIGQKRVDELYALKNKTTKADVHFFESRILELSSKIDKMK